MARKPRRKARGRFLAVHALFAALPASATAQNQEPVVIRTTARLVQVGVTVHDRGGAPVTGLRRDDFIVTEDGIPQQVSTLEPGGTGPAAVEWKPSAPQAVSNRSRTPRGATVILLDQLNTPALYQGHTPARISEFLDRAGPPERTAVYLLERELKVLSDFSDDPAQLRRIEVKVSGQGLQVRHRGGYFATADKAPNTEELRAELASAVWSPVDATGLGLEAWLEPVGAPATLVLRIDGAALEPQGERFACRLRPER